MTSVTIVIPFYNEENNLPVLFDELCEALSKNINELQINVIFVNDNSNDNGANIIEDKIKNLSNFELINLSDRSGQTGAFKVAFEGCNSDYILRMDSDLQDSPKDLHLFLEKIVNEEPDIIMGVRYARQHSLILRLSSNFYDLLIKLLFNTPLQTNSGSFIAFKSKFVQNLPWEKNDHRYLPLIVIYRGGTKVAHVKVNHRFRQFGSTNYPKLRKILFGPFEVIKFLKRLKHGNYNLN
jgi:dolichol-phosphate mannosyltransferase